MGACSTQDSAPGGSGAENFISYAIARDLEGRGSLFDHHARLRIRSGALEYGPASKGLNHRGHRGTQGLLFQPTIKLISKHALPPCPLCSLWLTAVKLRRSAATVERRRQLKCL